MYKYLKDHIYYDELYDTLTIRECKELEKNPYKKDVAKLKSKEGKIAKLKDETFSNLVLPISLTFLKAQRAADKSEKIQEWMERDRAKDEKLENAQEPESVRCLGCSSRLKKCISRDLMDDRQGKEKVLFMFECEQCGKRRAFWEDGKEWEYAPTCDKCNSEVQVDSSRNGNVIISEYVCEKCGYSKSDTLDLDKKDSDVDADFESNRKKYCIPESEGRELMRQAEGMKELVDKLKDEHKNKEIYEAADKIKKLTIADLEKLLVPVLKKSEYFKFEFEKPDIQKNVILGFSVQDVKTGRDGMNSAYDLKGLIKKTIKDTNWRLMSDGVNYRLGFLTGRIKGFESREDILKLVSKNEF